MKAEVQKRAFSLIEVLIALSILSMGILAIAKLQATAITGITYARHLTAATQLAEEKLEFLRTLVMDLDASATPQVNNVPLRDSSCGGSTSCHYLSDPTEGDTVFSPWHYELAPEVRTGMRFYTRWRVMRGGTGGVPGGGSPGPGQMYIQLQVIWWESNKDLPADLETVLKTGNLSQIRHKPIYGSGVTLQLIRQIDL